MVGRRLIVQGTVQGVGFRPFVYRLARELGLTGETRNDPGGLIIEATGTAARLDAFEVRLRSEAPSQAVVRRLDSEPIPTGDQDTFRIVGSTADGPLDALVPPDIATCPRCLQEASEPGDRRQGYAFTNCTDCGPRFTIVHRLPYDRAATTMESFTLCDDCATEYADPGDRRFHAQPNACPRCGPRLWLTDPSGAPIAADTPLTAAQGRLAQGQIGAIQGLGGFHLACDAANEDAVNRLRRRKDRPHRPFAVMARDLQVTRRLAEVTDEEAKLLRSWRAPIVLLEPRPHTLPPAVSGASGWLGVMLPYTPLHHLLLADSLDVLVMTSGNHRGAPMAHTHAQATTHLSSLVDFFLLHDRPIARRADDSVVRCTDHHPVLLRRSRGWVPTPVALPRGGPDQLALGGDLKSTCAVTRGAETFCGQHVGDLEHPEALNFLRSSATDLQGLLGTRPSRVIHDAHPDYHATRLARDLAAELGCPTLAVQHHHAHALACLAENGHDGPALAVVLDGAGWGPDHTVWGGEVLAVDGLRYERISRLLPLPLPGGDRAATEPWRMAAAVLHQRDPDNAARLLRQTTPETEVSDEVLGGVLALCASEHTLRTSSAGRLFDAAASLLGLCHRATFEGQAAMLLEHVASQSDEQGCGGYYHERPDESAPWEVDLLSVCAEMTRCRRTPQDQADGARRFHNALAAALRESLVRGREQTGLNTVALSGGVLQNRLVHERLVTLLEGAGFQVLVHRQVSPNDGGLSLGQAWAGVLADHDD